MNSGSDQVGLRVDNERNKRGIKATLEAFQSCMPNQNRFQDRLRQIKWFTWASQFIVALCPASITLLEIKQGTTDLTFLLGSFPQE